MGAVVMEAFVEHFDRNFNAIKDEMYAQFPREYTQFMRVEHTDRAFIKRSYMGGLGMPKQNRDLEPIPFVTPPKGPIALFTPVNYRLGYQIEKQTIEQEEWGLLANRPRSMLYGASVLMDITAANILNNGFTVQSYDFDPSGTAKALFNTAHTREDGLSTWANLINANLPITVETVFQAIVSLLYLMEDSIGLPIAYGGAFNILVPANNPTLWQQAVEVVNSTMNPNTSDNKVNAAIKTFKLNAIPLRFATNTDHWFVTWDVSSPGYGLLMVINIDPEISPLEKFGNNPDAWFSRLRTRFVAGYENKRGVGAVGA
jgi:hypothetical protein